MRKLKKGRKLSRKKDQRRALLKGLAQSLLLHGKMETTEARAKEVARFAEKLITKAKQGGLAARRELAFLSPIAAKKAMEWGAKFQGRAGGYTRILKHAPRKSDSSRLALVELVGE